MIIEYPNLSREDLHERLSISPTCDFVTNTMNMKPARVTTRPVDRSIYHIETTTPETAHVACIRGSIQLPRQPSPNIRVIRNGFDGSSRMTIINPNRPLAKRDRESSSDHLYVTSIGRLSYLHSHGVIAVYDRMTNDATLIGAVESTRGETTFRYNPEAHSVEIITWMDNVEMRVNEKYEQNLAIIRKPLQEALEEYKNVISPESESSRQEVEIGSFLWLERGKDVGARDILAQIERIKDLNLVWIDDGHAPIGDPLATNPHFFKGTNFRNLREFMDDIHRKGVKVGLWVSPFETSPKFTEHPDYIVKTENDRPYRIAGRSLANGHHDFFGGLRGLHLLDIRKPEVLDYLFTLGYELVHTFDIDSIKADFLNRAFFSVFIGNELNMTRSELYQRAMKSFIDGANKAADERGRPVDILLCQAPLFASLNINGGNFRMRYTDDMGPFPIFMTPLPRVVNYFLEKLHHKLVNPQGWFDRAVETAMLRRFLGDARSVDDGIVFNRRFGIDVELALSFFMKWKPKVLTVASDMTGLNQNGISQVEQMVQFLKGIHSMPQDAAKISF